MRSPPSAAPADESDRNISVGLTGQRSVRSRFAPGAARQAILAASFLLVSCTGNPRERLDAVLAPLRSNHAPGVAGVGDPGGGPPPPPRPGPGGPPPAAPPRPPAGGRQRSR